MTHQVNKYDIVTDLRRAIMASYSEAQFDDEEVRVFMKRAERGLDVIKDKIDQPGSYCLMRQLFEKAKDGRRPVIKRREDLLMIASLVVS